MACRKGLDLSIPDQKFDCLSWGCSKDVVEVVYSSLIRRPVVLCQEVVPVNDSAHSSEAQANAYGAQMAKYFTMNQPPHVAIDSAVSVVRPQLAITRLIARSGIPERTASIRKKPMWFRFI
jgi:hypothetical protein